MPKKYKPGDPELEKFRVKEEDLPSNFGDLIGTTIFNMYYGPSFLAHAEGTVLGLEFRVAELEKDLADEKKVSEDIEGTLHYVLYGEEEEKRYERD